METENIEITVGDMVQTNIEFINGGIPMNVIETNNEFALVSYFDTKGIDSKKWINKKDLTIINKTKK